MTEEWKQIEGYENYEVSNFGRVRNIKRNIVLIQSINRGGYYQLGLYKKKTHTISTHRLVGIAFVSNPDNKKYINHIDGDKTNNKASNLEWVSKSENALHAYKLGLMVREKGEDSPKAKLTNQQVIEIRNKYQPRKYSLNKLADEYNVSKRAILFIIQQATYKNVA